MMIVLSGINFFEGGGLSVFYDCLDELCGSGIVEGNQIIAFVHKKRLFEKYKNKIEVIELPKSRKSYIYRLYYEYIYFYKYSKKKDIDVWISMHDITPRVRAKKIYTYCHTPSPFMKKDITKLKYSGSLVAFSFFYKYLYRINIKAATAIIVQQDWMRNEFLQMYPVREVIVARPTMTSAYKFTNESKRSIKPVFMYASYPRYFKNYEVILKACEILQKKECNGYEVWLTIDGSENRYSYELREKYSGLKAVRWLGVLPRNRLFEKYEETDCLVFPSTMETWGMPISEFKETGKPMILADLPYAHEALGAYAKAVFFDPENEHELANIIRKFLGKELEYTAQKEYKVKQPYAENWNELFKMIL